jgi:hypothetical protein
MADVQAGMDLEPHADPRRRNKAASKDSKVVEGLITEYLLFSESELDDDFPSDWEKETCKKVRT